MSRPPSSESVFRAIAHRTRREVLERLSLGECAAGKLFAMRNISKPTLSSHLRVLRAAGLVMVRRKGTSLMYRLNGPAVKVVQEWALKFRRIH